MLDPTTWCGGVIPESVVTMVVACSEATPSTGPEGLGAASSNRLGVMLRVRGVMVLAGM